MLDETIASDGKARRRLHPAIIRTTHWINAVAMIVMIGSGWKIYNDEVLFGWLHFPDWITIGGEAQGALQWHFAAMWVLAINGLVYLAYAIASGRFRRMLTPLNVSGVFGDFRDALQFKLNHSDITRYNFVQKLFYVIIIPVIIVQVISGLTIWKPVMLSELMVVFGDFQTARLVHFLGMSAIVGFIVVHVALALLVPKSLLAMLTGGPRVPKTEAGGPVTVLEPAE